ncbi:hypothetical protein Tco_0098261 [Tanacetum coccineum]
MKRVTRGYSGKDIPLFPSMITAPKTSPSRITSLPSLSPQHTPVSAPSTSPPPITETTPTVKEPAPMPHESPLQSVQSLGHDEGSLSLHELTVLCTNLSNKVTSLEAELAQTKQTYGTALTKLIKKVKKLEQNVKISQSRRSTRVVLSDAEEVSEDPSKQRRKIQEKISDDTEGNKSQGSDEKGEQEVTTTDTTLNTGSIPISTASATLEVSTAAANLVYIRRSVEKRKDKGKAIMIKDESIQKKKRITRDAKIAKQLQEEYDKAGKKEAVTEVDTAHVIDWNDPFIIRAGEDAETEPAKRQRTKEVSESVQEQTNEEPKTNELSQEQLNQMIIIVLDEVINVEALQTKYPIIRWEVHSDDNMDDLVKLWSLVQERYNSSGLTEDKEIELWVELKMLFKPDAEKLLELQKYTHDPLKWWLYDMCAVHHVSTEKGKDIFMLVENDYPLTKGLVTLNVNTGRTKLSTARPKLSTDSTKIESMKLEAMVEERRIFKCWVHYHTTNGHQFTMSNRHQELASPEQTASALAIPEQTATGKEISPFMAGSLPKTTWPT